jgi:hemerythrin-like domain-containing protein
MEELPMHVQIGTSAQASFEQPLQLLMDCHRRIEHFLQVLVRVVHEASGEEFSDEQRRALETALTYFRDAAPRHTQDEEDSLFPRLRQSAGTETTEALELMDALEADHARADTLHRQVDAKGFEWLRSGEIASGQRDEMCQWLEELQELYRRHLQIEDGEIFPLAGRTLTPEAIRAVGFEMKARRSDMFPRVSPSTGMTGY